MEVEVLEALIDVEVGEVDEADEVDVGVGVV